MTDFEVPEAIICSPFEEPAFHWHLEEGADPDKRQGRRPAIYYYPVPASDEPETSGAAGTAIELKLVNLIRARVKQWRADGTASATWRAIRRL